MAYSDLEAFLGKENSRLKSERDELLAALKELLELSEQEMSWATEGEPCDMMGDSVCSQCQNTGCARLKIDRAISALAMPFRRCIVSPMKPRRQSLAPLAAGARESAASRIE
jgi:hypothetical protein